MESSRPLAEAQVAERLQAVGRKIEEAAHRVGRDPQGVRLVVVTKGHVPAMIRQAHAGGIRRLGENRVEEAVAKQDELRDLREVEWHLIGPLQSRKVRLVQNRFHLIHAIDRLKIARLLEDAAAAQGWNLRILLECNVSGEPSKAGWRLDSDLGWETALPDLRQIASMAHLQLDGLMTMAPITQDIELQRRTFRRLADVRRRLQEALGSELPELSMGMSDDYPVAVEEGATLVRIGRAILGQRM